MVNIMKGFSLKGIEFEFNKVSPKNMYLKQTSRVTYKSKPEFMSAAMNVRGEKRGKNIQRLQVGNERVDKLLFLLWSKTTSR